MKARGFKVFTAPSVGDREFELPKASILALEEASDNKGYNKEQYGDLIRLKDRKRKIHRSLWTTEGIFHHPDLANMTHAVHATLHGEHMEPTGSRQYDILGRVRYR